MISPILSVADVSQSIAFYTEKLGFVHHFSLESAKGVVAFAYVCFGQSYVGFSRKLRRAPMNRGLSLMVYLPDNMSIRRYYEGLLQRDVPIVEPLKEQYWGDHTFSIADPDAYIISFAKTVQHISLADIQAMMRGEAS